MIIIIVGYVMKMFFSLSVYFLCFLGPEIPGRECFKY